MTTAETLAEYYGLTNRVIKRQLDGVTHEESLLIRSLVRIPTDACNTYRGLSHAIW